MRHSTFIPAKRRVHRKRRGATQSAPPLTGPVLVAAEWDSGQMLLTLTFDRPVNATGLQQDSVVVFDGNAVTEYRNNGDVNQPTPEVAEVSVVEFGEFLGTGERMTASAATDIVAVVGGEEWAGVTNLPLPFP